MSVFDAREGLSLKVQGFQYVNNMRIDFAELFDLDEALRAKAFSQRADSRHDRNDENV